ncbi:MAG: tRNA (adenosine(37)-N6)-threonylcarbamoyltransferase complex dimerization subunit type 1 TsaB [Pseudomonadota bacterium]|nr:tRNA (adenosine(37)-N6)-threonylcarbamoyltransferase complex dimerization subunit type 1 TsaB [Pseudomonadota bacterium]
MTTVLALDASSCSCSAGLLHDRRLDFERSESPRAAARELLPMVDALLKKAGISVADLDLIAVSAGPGSFTGVRIGLGVAQGLGESAGVEVLAVSSLAHVAYEASLATGKQVISVFMHARECEYYLGTYHLSPKKNEFRVISEQVVRADSISEACLTQNLHIDTNDWVLTGDALQSVLEKGLTTEAGRSVVGFTPPAVVSLCGLAELMKKSGHTDLDRVAQANYVKEVLDYPKS